MNEEIRVVIADDEPGMRQIERKIIQKVDGFTLMGEATNGRELLELVDKYHPQLVFLDVEMPEMTGVEAARSIQDTNPQTVLVFATAHDDYMADAFEVYAFDYLIKPFKLDRVMKTLERARDRILRKAQEQDEPIPALPAVPKSKAVGGRLMLRHREGINFINRDDILLIQRENRATVLYLMGGGRFETSDSLTEIESRLGSAMFFRCHKSYIINLNYIQSITPYGRWTYILKLEGTKQDALITHERYEELQRMFG